MRTRRLPASEVGRAADILRHGGLVGFPTETVYGLGADALNAAAVARIFVAKGRPADNPLILHVTGGTMARALAADWPVLAERLTAAFWPGPLTVVVARAAGVPDEATAGLETVGLRAPAHPLAQALIRALDTPIAAPSANRSGRPSPTTAADVIEDLDGRIDAVLDGGATGVGVESTVVDATGLRPRLLRPGGLPLERIEALVGPLAEPGEGPARSPGMRYRHYAPRTPLLLAAPAEIERILAARPAAVALLTDETAAALTRRPAAVRLLGARDDPQMQARRLFACLRALDRARAPLIVAERVPETGLGRAVMDRLRRASQASPLQ